MKYILEVYFSLACFTKFSFYRFVESNPSESNPSEPFVNKSETKNEWVIYAILLKINKNFRPKIHVLTYDL